MIPDPSPELKGLELQTSGLQGATEDPSNGWQVDKIVLLMVRLGSSPYFSGLFSVEIQKNPWGWELCKILQFGKYSC